MRAGVSNMKKTFLIVSVFVLVLATVSQSSYAQTSNANSGDAPTTNTSSGNPATTNTNTGAPATTNGNGGFPATTNTNDGSAPTTNTNPRGNTQPRPGVATLPNPLGNIGDIPTLINKIINYVVTLSYAVVAFFLIYSGFKFVSAAGNKDKLDEAKHTFYYTIIGALIVIGANTLVKIYTGLIKSLGL